MVQEDRLVEEPEYGLGWNAKKEGEVFKDVKEDVEEDSKRLEEIYKIQNTNIYFSLKAWHTIGSWAAVTGSRYMHKPDIWLLKPNQISVSFSWMIRSVGGWGEIIEGGMPKRVGCQIREWKLSVLKSGAHLSSESLESWLGSA
jgi:hypothetical protein